MFHIECVRCIVQLFFCNRMILKSHEPPGCLCPKMVRWCKKTWPDEARLNIMGSVNRKQWFLPLNIGLSGFNFPIIQFGEIMIEIA